MKVICKKIDAQGLDLREITTIFSNGYDYSFGGYGLELNKEYLVMGIALYRDTNCTYYLIDVNGRPYWFPYVLFKISNNFMPKNWFIKIYDDNDNIMSLIGFYELCNNEHFYDELTMRDVQAMKIYFNRKSENEINEVN